MNLKNLPLLFVFMNAIAIFSQKSASVKITHFPANTLVNGQSKFVTPNYIKLATTNLNCFSFLDVDVYVRASGDKEKPYRYKVVVTNTSNYDVSVNCSNWGFGSGGASTVKAHSSYDGSGGNLKATKNPIFSIYDIDIVFNQSIKTQYPFYYDYTNNIDCKDTPQSLINEMKYREQKENKIATLKSQISNLGDSEADLNLKLALYNDLKSIDTKRDYTNQIEKNKAQLKRITDERTRKNEEISTLQKKINSLSNSEEDLIEKKELYESLAAVDEEHDYREDISNIDKKIASEKEKQALKSKGVKKEETDEEDANSKESENDEEEYGLSAKEKEEVERERIAKEKKLEEEAKERERKRKEEQERIKKEKIEAYNNRIESQRKENNAIAAAAGASSASVLYLLGGVIYDRMGLPGKDLYTGDNFHVNFDIGYGFSVFPISYASERTGTSFSTGDIISTKENTDNVALTIDLRMAFKFGYETEYGGGNLYGRFEPGFSPIFTDFNTSYGYGIEFFGGHEIVKLYGRYELGSQNFSANNWLDPEEIGEGGKSSTKYKQVRAGLKFSFYKNRRTAKRDHIIIGIAENYFDENSAPVFSTREIPDEPILGLIKTAPRFLATGYFLEWKRDHTHRLYIEFFSNYPVTGEIGGTSGEGKFFMQAGFSRSIEGFFKSKK